MAKSVVAAVRIKKDGKVIDAGAKLNPDQFTQEELVRLYDRGAVKVVDDSEPREATLSDVQDVGKAQESDQTDQEVDTKGSEQTQTPTAPATAPPATPTKSTPTSATPTKSTAPTQTTQKANK